MSHMLRIAMATPFRLQLRPGRLPTLQVLVRTPQRTQQTYAASASTPATIAAVKSPLQRRKGGDLGFHLPRHVIPAWSDIPPYPYGDRALFKQANGGLYGGQMIQFGNNVSPDTETKTRRKWKPNVLSKSLYSVALKKRIKLRVTARVLKTMDREGGLDAYLLKDSEQRLKELGPLGWDLRWTLLQKPEVIDRMRSQAAALGVDQATIDAQWPKKEMKANSQLGGDDVVDKQNNEEATNARKDYFQANRVAKHYLEVGHTDSFEEGIKLFFIRQRIKRERAERFHKINQEKNEKLFSDDDVQEIRTRMKLTHQSDEHVRRIAFAESRIRLRQEAGPEALKTGRLAARNARIAEAGGQEAYDAMNKARFAQMIREAESASSNEELDPLTRQYLEHAIKKANWMIKALDLHGQDTYVGFVMKDLEQTRLGAPLNKEKDAGVDAWGALVNPSNNVVEEQPHA